MNRAGALAAVLGLLAAGCSLVPDYVRPEAPTPQAWFEPSDGEAAEAPEEWWRTFDSPELNALLAETELRNYDLKAAAARIAQAIAQARATRAALLPSVDGQATAARDYASNDGGSTRSIDGSFRGQLTASWELDLFGGSRASTLAAVEQLAATREDREALALALYAEVTSTYFQYLSLGDRLATARKTIAIARRILELIELRSRLGAISGLQVAQQRASVAQLEASLPALEQQRAQTYHALAALVGAPSGAVALQEESLATLSPPQIGAGLPSELLERRPDIRRAEAQLRAANADIGAARAAFFPRLSLTVDGGFGSDALGRFLDQTSFAGIGLSVLQPIFSAGRLDAQLEATRARYTELAELYRGAVISAFRDVEDALAAQHFLRETEAAQEEAVLQARAAYDLAETQFRGGAVDFLSVLDAQRTLFQAEDALLRTRFDRLNAAVALYRALGGGWQAAGT